VRLDARSLDGTTVRSVVERSGELERTVIVQRQDGLYRTLAEAVGAHYHRAFLILQGAGDDLRSRSAAAIDQNHQRDTFAGIRRVGVETQLRIGDAAL